MRPAACVVLALALGGGTALAGCSGDDAGEQGAGSERVLEQQRQAIDKARDVGRQLGEAAKRKEAAQQ